MNKKHVITSILILLSILALSGCTSSPSYVSNDITGTIKEVELIEHNKPLIFWDMEDEIKITFSNDSYCIIETDRIDDDGTDWYEVLKPYEGKRVKITYAISRSNLNILSVEFIGDLNEQN